MKIEVSKTQFWNCSFRYEFQSLNFGGGGNIIVSNLEFEEEGSCPEGCIYSSCIDTNDEWQETVVYYTLATGQTDASMQVKARFSSGGEIFIRKIDVKGTDAEPI